MTDISAGRESICWWSAYLKAAAFLVPPVALMAGAIIFVVPKIKQMCAETGYDAAYLFAPLDFVMSHVWLITAVCVLLFAVLEKLAPVWRRYRSSLLACFVFLVNTAVLLGFAASLMVSAMVGSAVSRHF